MKLDKIFAALFIGLAMTACSNDDEMTTGGQDQSPVTGGTAYMSVSLNMPKSTGGTRASGTNRGSTAEQTVGTVLLALFDASDICVQARTLLPGEYQVTVGSTAGTAGSAFQVPATTKKALAVINPSADFQNRCVVSAGWAAINAALTTSVTDVIGTAEDNFMMINAGDATTHKALIDVTGNIKTVGGAIADATAAKAAAAASPAAINVERVVAKVSLQEKTGGAEVTAPGATCTFGDWALNVTNKDMFPFSEIVTPIGSMIANYRKDNNYAAGSFNVSKFNYLALDATTGALPADFTTMGVDKYCLENTMDATEQKMAQTTSAVVSAVYTPAGYTADKSWFRLLGTSYETLADLKAVYAAAAAAGSPSPLQTQQKNLCNEFYVRIAAMATAQGATWNASDFSSLDIDEMDDIVNGGEASKPAVIPANPPTVPAATVQDLGVEYFQKGTCYYSILIRHDDAVTGTMELGKYGVVRNNWYTLTINTVKQPGTPWIPDPTNPIVPTDPGDDNDEAESFLAVGITVNPWITWSQGVDL